MKTNTFKIETIRFQRNGVAGEPFYHCFVRNLPDAKGRFLITFQTDSKDLTINTGTCRVVCLDQFNAAWRGDNIGYDLQKRLDTGLASERLRRNNDSLTIYDLITL